MAIELFFMMIMIKRLALRMDVLSSTRCLSFILATSSIVRTCSVKSKKSLLVVPFLFTASVLSVRYCCSDILL
ncbi:uncharacterized protein BX663DRAFT_503878 [Cokeromyces recurvatus]|uniref:uncharacterized protein n=1 Tax=Cokeromyces recurvatus TaxID=90255 RepID=UPI002220C016|nr:uncharacterized protein BX663DRAFT_503878 [Cokeromyces recurvatus]KAI7904872.1 hypothetical protein BX663DRAFT_503878 [Cokeromyces recurvatus]